MSWIYDDIDDVETREDLARYINQLRIAASEGELDNATLDLFLDGLAAWTQDMDGVFQNRGERTPDVPSWNLFARMLLAASFHERWTLIPTLPAFVRVSDAA